MISPYIGNFHESQPFTLGQHNGLDLVGDSDKTLYAICDGYIGSSTMVTDKNNRTWQWGNYIKLVAENDDEVDDGLLIYYCHMSKRLVEQGQRVKRGDLIGIEGNTGYSFGSHCHFEIRDRDNVVKSVINTPEVTGIPNEKGKYYFQFESEEKLMSKEKEELQKEIDELKKRLPKVYHYMIDVPEWARPTMQALYDKKVFVGASERDLNLSEDLMRTLYILSKQGAFKK